MNRKKILIYGIIPIGSAITMVLMYFSGIDFLVTLIAPNIPNLYPNSSREFGLLENLQNVLLLGMLAITVIGFRRKSNLLEKTALVGIGCFTLLIFLEEIDYGLHYYELLRGIEVDEAVKARNLHNVPGRTPVIKKVLDSGMVMMFLILPIALRNNRNPFVQHILPDKFSTITLLGSFAVSAFAHALDDRGFAEGGLLHQNISEFREYLIYYLFMLYLGELTLRRQWGASPTPEKVDPLRSNADDKVDS